MTRMKILVVLSLVFFLGTTVTAQNFKYVGVAKCKMCHNKDEKGNQWKQWTESKHSKAMASLKGADAKNPKCLKCHSTLHSVSDDLVDTITEAEGVSCESCHGPGSAYKTLTVMKSREASIAKGLIIPDEKLCKKCHNPESPTFKGFNYAEMLKKVAHPNPLAGK